MIETPLLNGLRVMLHQFTIIEKEAWQDLVQRLEIFEYQKGDTIKKFNSEVTDLHFVMQGIARHCKALQGTILLMKIMKN